MMVLLVSLVFSSMSFAAFQSFTQDENILVIHEFFSLPLLEEKIVDDELYTSIFFEGTKRSGNPGEPFVPLRSVMVLIPHGKEVKDISFEIKDEVFLGDGFVMEPVAIPVALHEIEKSIAPVPDELIYSSDDLFPSTLVNAIGVQWIRGFQVYILTICPLHYRPYSGSLYYYEGIEVHIHLKDSSTVDNVLFRGLQKDVDAVLKVVDTSEFIQTYSIDAKSYSSTPFDMLIITNEELKNDFVSLKHYHNARGLNTVIMTVEDIYSLYTGVDEPEKIRNCIIDKYMVWGLDYVLLGGDVDVVPVRYLSAVGQNQQIQQIPSDLYYACLDGCYNYNGNGLWGEPDDGINGGEVDLFAEVYVGRAPVNNSFEVNNFTSKTIRYLDYDGSEEYLSDILMAAQHLGFGGPMQYGGISMDQLINGSTADGYSTIGIPSSFYTIDKLYENPDFSWGKEDISEIINSNVHIINHLGHGTEKKVMQLFRNDVLNLVNDHPFFVYSQACLAGYFDLNEGDCIAEYFTVKTQNASFAGIWNARYGFGTAYNTDGPSQRYHRQFINAVFGEGILYLSHANHHSKHMNVFLINESRMRFVCYGLNLLGDPSVMFHINSLYGENILIKHEDGVVYNGGSVDIGSLEYGQKSKTVVFTIENCGEKPLLLCDDPVISIKGEHADDYEVSFLPASTVIYPGQSEDFHITFRTEYGGRRRAEVVIRSNDASVNAYSFFIFGRRWHEAYNYHTNVLYHTIQDAIDDANDREVIVVEEGEYFITDSIVIDKNIVLRGMSGADATIINGLDSYQRCVMLNSSRAIIDGFTITSGFVSNDDVGGGIKIGSDGGTVSRCIIVGNRAGRGGGIFVENIGMIRSCYVMDNWAWIGGGGIFSDEGSVIIRNSYIVDNYAFKGGGMYSSGILEIYNSNISYNTASYVGGGVYSSNALVLENCLVSFNTANEGGAGIFLDESSSMQIINLCTIVNNSVLVKGLKGGGIRAFNSICFISNSIIYGNTMITDSTPSTSSRRNTTESNEIAISNYFTTGSALLSFSYSCTTPLPTMGIGNIADDPLFVGLGLNPFMIGKFSACVDAGNPDDVLLPIFDLAGRPRISNGRVDMGAYEYQRHPWIDYSVEVEITTPDN